MIAPLLSQPIVELGLQGASWDWCAGGHDRALARAAFADRLAPMVRDRRTKGRVESLFVTSYNRRRGSIREFLLEGYLASAGIIDRDAVDAALQLPADALDAVYIRLLQIADVERWIRSL
jgi:asparagine synthase (glutamine-hydrolysing)